MMAGLIETVIIAIIDAMSLCEVINLKKDQRIMQPTCNNLGATLA
jgi:hypothetical protein